MDQVLTRTPEPQRFWAGRTARVVTAQGYRYRSGVGQTFLQQWLVVLLRALGARRSRLRMAAGARWMRAFFPETLAHIPTKTIILDWYHLQQKCRDLSRRICRGKGARARFLWRWYRRLWRGDVPAAGARFEAYRSQTKHVALLETLIASLQARAEWMPNERQWRSNQPYVGSGHGATANDLIVARRQTGRGMPWSLETSDALAALRTLRVPGGWERYGQQRQGLPLVAS